MRLEKRILIADDDDAIRSLLVTVLRRRGFLVDAVRNGAEALDKLSSSRYSLMILDLMMPIATGHEVLEQLGEMSAASRPVVLVLTAGLEPRRFDTTFVVGIMSKPFDIELLVATVAGCLQATDPRQQVERSSEPQRTPAPQREKVN